MSLTPLSSQSLAASLNIVTLKGHLVLDLQIANILALEESISSILSPN